MKTVRDGRKVWPYCSECGCRLHIAVPYVLKPLDPYVSPHDTVYLWHFDGDVRDRDAKGCQCSLIETMYTLPITEVVQFVGE